MSDINLGDKPYIKTHALNLSHEHLFSNLKSLTNLSFGQNKHQECVDCASSDTRSNTSKSISQTLTFPLTDNWIVESNGTFADYNAKATYETYEMSTLIASTVYSSSFGNVSLSKNVSYSHYEDIDPLANIKRTITVDSKNISFMTAPFQLDKDSQSILNIFRLARPRADDWILKLNFQWGETRSPIKTYQKDIEEISFSIIKNF
jgi:hypothetical protein